MKKKYFSVDGKYGLAQCCYNFYDENDASSTAVIKLNDMA